MAHRNRRRGIKALEVMVVVFILFCALALLLPMLADQGHSAGPRTTCLNNVRNLSFAMQNFDGQQGHLPGYRNLMVGDPAVRPDASAAVPASWVLSILPDLEQSQLAADASDRSEVLDFTRLGYANEADPRVLMPQLTVLVCPSDARWARKTPGVPYKSRPSTSYVVNCGQPDSVEARQRGEPADSLANGVFQDGLAYAWAEGRVLRDDQGKPIPATVAVQQLSAIQAGDGASVTVMFSENLDAGFWPDHEEWNIGFVWVPQSEPHRRFPFDGATHTLRASNRDGGEVDDVCGPALGSPLLDAKRYAFARPSSNHPGGVNVAFCDGHTSFLSDAIDYVVWCQLMTPRGHEARDVQRDAAHWLVDDPDPTNDVLATYRLQDADLDR